jgi:SAM-dependent methyltransferase
MSVFGEYSAYYDLFYQDKDYPGEAAFVRGLIQKHFPAAQSVLDLGCGTSRHARELVRSGFTVTGVDLSAGMIARGLEEAAQLPEEFRRRLELVQGDATSFTCSRSYDAVISLFHVLSYQTTNAALRGVFRTARRAVRANGLFVFDFWHGPAVLTGRPETRIKRAENAEVRVIRLAEPTLDVNRSVVAVSYTLLARNRQGGECTEVRETHTMRYLFMPEIELLAELEGFQIIEAGEWLTGRPLTDQCWSGYAVARATGEVK